MNEDQDNVPTLGGFEELVLLAVFGLKGNAYGVSISDRLNETRRKVVLAAVYTTLERLEAKGLISSSLGESTPERGGRAKRFYEVTGLGERALALATTTRKLLAPQFVMGAA